MKYFEKTAVSLKTLHKVVGSRLDKLDSFGSVAQKVLAEKTFKQTKNMQKMYSNKGKRLEDKVLNVKNTKEIEKLDKQMKSVESVSDASGTYHSLINSEYSLGHRKNLRGKP